MTKRRTIVCGLAFVLALLFAAISCTDSQSGIILTDTTGDGKVDSRGVDGDGDGNIDLDIFGNEKIMPGLGPYKYSKPVDAVAPSLFGIAEAVSGLSILGIIGVWWRKAKPAKMAANLVQAIQIARLDVKENGNKAILPIMDKALAAAMEADPELRAWIIKKKAALGLESVTDDGA